MICHLYDQNKETVKSALDKLDAILNRLIEKHRISKEEKKQILKCITVIDQISEFSKADFVIEAIIEDLEIKKTLFKALSQVIMNDCILATNTSSLSVTNLASSSIDPRRFLGVHFFNPAPLMPLVEAIPALLNSIGSILGSITLGILSVLFITFFLLKDGEYFEKIFILLFPS